MKVVAAIIFFAGFAVLLIDNAAADSALPSNGSILSPCGEFIPGKFELKNFLVSSRIIFDVNHLFSSLFLSGSIQRLIGPIFEKMKNHVSPCGLGYIRIMLSLLNDIDSSVECDNATSLGLLFKTYINICKELIPFIQDKSLSDALCQAVQNAKQSQAEITNEHIDLNSLNELAVTLSKNLNDSLNKCSCSPCQSKTEAVPAVVHRTLLNLPLL